MNDDQTPLIEWNDDKYALGIPGIDNTHREFIALLNDLAQADNQEFLTLFDALLEHTQAHFENENMLMEKSGFPPTAIHQAEHQRVLTELGMYKEKAEQGDISTVKNYILNHIPDWFEIHAATMDSALAWHLRAQGMTE